MDSEEESPIAAKIREAERLAREQQERLNKMSEAERRNWGFQTSNAKDQAAKDEKSNPTK